MTALNRSVGTDLFRVILVVDDDRQRQEQIANEIGALFGKSYLVRGADGEAEATAIINSVLKDNIVLVAVDLDLGLPEGEIGHERAAAMVRALRQQLPDTARILAYTFKELGEIEDAVVKAGASRYVRADAVKTVITELFLESELRALATTSPLIDRIFNAIDIGISIQDDEMRVIWANDKTKRETGVTDIVGQTCWHGYHHFFRRRHACARCVAWRVRAEALARQSANEPSTHKGLMYLPIKGRVGCVEVAAAPFLNHGRTQVLAVIEVTRFITEEWEQESPAHQRLKTVIDYAREMGRVTPISTPLAYIAVYYRPPKSERFFLFDSAKGEGVEEPRTVLRRDTLTAQETAIVDGGGCEFVLPASPRVPLHHYLWSRTTNHGIRVFIDVAFADFEQRELVADDLGPYWEYVTDVFDDALGSREADRRTIAEEALREFLARTRERAERPGPTQKDLVKTVMTCVRKTLHPASMYIRRLDRRSNTLVLSDGFGFFPKIAVERRPLDIHGVGSGLVAATRKGFWNYEASVEDMLPNIGVDNHASNELRRIASYATLPLIFSQRVLGTLNVQFEDDALFSKANQELLESLVNALGSAMGRLEWIEERRRLTDSLEKMDKMAFTPLPANKPLQEECRVVRAACRMVFEVTATELVAYYRYDPLGKRLELVDLYPPDQSPKATRVPTTMSSNVGVLRRIIESQDGYFAEFALPAEKSLQDDLIATLSDPQERAFCERVACEAVWPVMVHKRLQGVLLAMSFIPGWLSQEDIFITGAYSKKIGLCLAAKMQSWQLDRDGAAMSTIWSISTVMARTANVETMYRLLLLGITAGECLRFGRAILFRRRDNVATGELYEVAYAVGASSLTAAQSRWAEADGLTIQEKILACDKASHPVRPGDIWLEVQGLTLDADANALMFQQLRDGKILTRHRGDPHIIVNTRLRELLAPEGRDDVEYVLAPLRSIDGFVGLILADRAFVDPPEIHEEINLLALLIDEWRAAIDRLQRTEIAERLAWGVSYSLRSRAGVLQAQLSNLKADLGDQHAEAINDMRRSIEFFRRAGTLASECLRANELGLIQTEPVDLPPLLRNTIKAIGDPRISLELSDETLLVQGDQRRLEDVCVELLLNARDFTPPKSEGGKIAVRLSRSGEMAQVDFIDNGKGIHPGIRPYLFSMFKCYPVNRMGLGLAYVGSVLTALRGSIEEVAPKKGTQFVVRIPLIKGESR